MPEIPGVQDLTAKTDRWAKFRGLKRWQLPLVLIPIALPLLGGIVGGAIGVPATLINLTLARAQLPTLLKVMAMAGILAAAYCAYIALYFALHN